MKKARGKNPSAAASHRDDTSDAGAFELEMADVARLGPDPHGRVRLAPPVRKPPATALPDDDFFGPDEGFTAPGVDRREIRKLQRGEYAAGDRCDLHGLTVADACATAGRFIENSRYDQRRCVCIVHGRGLHSERKTSILKARVRACLRSNRSVLAYADAPPSDGGSGAVYVLLRK